MTEHPPTQPPPTQPPPTQPADPPGQSPQPFDTEVGQAVSYENGLAVKALIALALVAALVLLRIFGG
jgi:hypothetical protein